MTLKLNHTLNSDDIETVTEGEALLSLRARLINYSGPYLVSVNGKEQEVDTCDEAVQVGVSAALGNSIVIVKSKSQPSASWTLTPSPVQKTAEETIAQMDDEDEVMPVITEPEA